MLIGGKGASRFAARRSSLTHRCTLAAPASELLPRVNRLVGKGLGGHPNVRPVSAIGLVGGMVLGAIFASM
ncbi:hypothetical protein GCM10010284_22470 [Streptomyces rubiginosohelvolus]|uniref:Uncharacterized protein n=1 Tax=Streptomyces rubiginosohelvolus TaxID=67362 RepID=A0ABQ3CBV2_9ACTN|nr:hypothetical protein GCM10010284_22470 [Streptomyces rubiginosohelvolus]GGZ78085.1 hypothetical protein GCM10010328_61180 [Streptomyces pluricolorescens]